MGVWDRTWQIETQPGGYQVDHRGEVPGVPDLDGRKLIGWAMGSSIDSALVLSALSMAIRHRGPAAGLLFHSDRGAQ